MNNYLIGQAEAQLDIVPGLMPESYILGRLDAKTKKHPDKNKPGFDWVADPSVKDGGYYRKAKSSAGSTVAKVAAVAVLAGAGAAAIASANRKSTTTPPRSPIPSTLPVKPIVPKTTNLNKKAVVAAGVVGAAGVSAISANRMQNAQSAPKQPSPESKMPANTKVQYKQVPDPWSSTPDVPDPWDDAPKPASGQSSVNPQNAQLPPARYIQRKPQEPDPWEAQTSNSRAMSEQSSAATAMPDTLPALPPAKPVVYKRPFVAKTRKLRETINLAKRERTGLAKAQENLELGLRLQEKTNSPVDVRRGVDVEMNANERIANLQARSPARTPAGLVTIRGTDLYTQQKSVRANETAEESKTRKKKELDREKLLAESQALLDETVPTLETKPEGKLVRSPPENKLTRQQIVKGTVEVAKDIIETGDIPSRAEIANFLGYAAGSTVKRAVDLSKEKNPIGAAKQLIEEGNERERKVREIAKKAGIDVPSRGDIVYNAGLKIGDPLVAAAEKGVELLKTPDGIVNTAGFLASKAGAATGIPGAGLALDLGGALVMRKVVTDIEAVKRAYKQLKDNEAYITATPISKVQQVTKASIDELETKEAQEKLKDDFLADKTGWAIGNAVAETVPVPVPFKGAAVALVTVPTVAEKIKNQGVLKTAANLPIDTIRAIQALPEKMQEPTIRGNKREEEARAKFKNAILTSKKRLKQANTVRKLVKKERKAKRVITKTRKNIREARELAARLNNMKKRSSKTDSAVSSVQNGQTWVKDPRKKRGGYWRRTRKGVKKVGGAIASQLLGAAVVGTGAALATHHAIETGKKQAHVAANDVAQKFGKQVNKAAIAGAAISGLAIGAAGTAAIASRQKRKDAVVATGNPVLDEDAKQFVQRLLRQAISPVFPSIRAIVAYRLERDRSITGVMTDIRNRPFTFEISEAGKVTYGKPNTRTDKVADICKTGVQCGKGCVSPRDRCAIDLPPQSKAAVDVARDIIETGDIPSRKELANLAGRALGKTVRHAANLVKEKGVINATKQLVREGNERERQVRGLASMGGVDVASRSELAREASTNIGKQAVAVATNPDTIVNTVGFVASKAGAATGIPGAGLALDLGGALATRKVIADISATKRAYKQLKDKEVYITASPVSKVQQLAKASIDELETAEAQEKLKDDFLSDKTGWAIGNAVAETVPAPIPLKGAAVAMAATPSVTKKIKDQGIVKTIKDLPKDTVNAVAGAPSRLKTVVEKAIEKGNERERKAREKFKQSVQSAKLVSVDLNYRKLRGDSTEKQQDAMHSVMSRYKKRKLHIGRSKYKVKSRKQAIAIGLNISGQSRNA